MSSSGTSSGRRQSALLIPVPEADAVVGPWRHQHDPVAPAGVPAHVTLVVPWLRPEEITDADVEELREVLAGEDPWDFDLEEVGWFGRRVLWLAPRPVDPFVALTHRLAEHFGTPPYDDEFDEVVPHLTIGHASDGVELAPVAAAVEATLPVRCRAGEVWAMIGDGVRWERHTSIRLGAPTPTRQLTGTEPAGPPPPTMLTPRTPWRTP